MRALLLALTLFAAGCVSSEGELPADKNRTLEPWVGHWDNVPERYPALGLSTLRTGEHVKLRALHASSRQPVTFEEDRAHVLVVVQGEGFLEFKGPEGLERVALQPGHSATLPRGGARVSARGGELWALVATSTQPEASPAARAVVLPVEELFPPDVVDGMGQIVEVGRQKGLSLHAGGIGKLSGLRRHAHLEHDLILFFLSGEGTLGLGSEAGDTSGKSVGDRQLKRGYVSSPVSERAIAFLPAGSPHSFISEGLSTTLVLMIYGPGFNGRDGFAVPDANNRPKAKVTGDAKHTPK